MCFTICKLFFFSKANQILQQLNDGNRMNYWNQHSSYRFNKKKKNSETTGSNDSLPLRATTHLTSELRRPFPLSKKNMNRSPSVLEERSACPEYINAKSPFHRKFLPPR
jgi:hypothetical protein